MPRISKAEWPKDRQKSKTDRKCLKISERIIKCENYPRELQNRKINDGTSNRIKANYFWGGPMGWHGSLPQMSEDIKNINECKNKQYWTTSKQIIPKQRQLPFLGLLTGWLRGPTELAQKMKMLIHIKNVQHY